MLGQTVYFGWPHVLRYVGFEADVLSMGIPRTRNIKLNTRRGDALQQVRKQLQDMFLGSLDFSWQKVNVKVSTQLVLN
jgi:hypothetical protein